MQAAMQASSHGNKVESHQTCERASWYGPCSCSSSGPRCEEVDSDTESVSGKDEDPERIGEATHLAADAMNSFSATIVTLSEQYKKRSAAVMEKSLMKDIELIRNHWQRLARDNKENEANLSGSVRMQMNRLT